MARNDDAKKYKNIYANLLGLYPASYRRRFAEPMQQTFSDLCHERVQAGEGLFGFAMGTYAGTFIEIIKEHIKGVVMSSKATKMKIFAAVAGVSVLVVAAVFIVIGNRPSIAQSISPYSSLEQARELSKGQKEPCLMDTQQAHDAVKKDDVMFEFGDEKMSRLELEASGAIMDVPAGTDFRLTTHSYKDGVVKGAMAYEYGYGIYNYTIKKLPKAGEWKLVSIIACERS